MGHDHGFNLAPTAGPALVGLVSMLGSLAVAAFALLRSFVPESGRSTHLVVTTAAGGVLLLRLLLTDAIDVPRAAVALLLAAIVVPLVATVRSDPPRHPFAVLVRRLAPWLLVVTACGAGIELARAVTGAGDFVPLASTAISVSLVGISWLTMGPARHAGLHVAAWVLGNALIAGTALTALDLS